MDTFRPVSVEHELLTVSVVFVVVAPAAPGTVDNSAVVVG
jgi:hypothetical protein